MMNCCERTVNTVACTNCNFLSLVISDLKIPHLLMVEAGD